MTPLGLGSADRKSTRLAAGLRQWIGCRICRRVTAGILLSIVLIEAAILIPSVLSYRRDLLLRLEHSGLASISATYATNGHASPRDLVLFGRMLMRHSQIVGAKLYFPDGTAIGEFGEIPSLSLQSKSTSPVLHRLTGDGRRYDVAWLAADTGLPISLVARLDASWIEPELWAFVWRMMGLVLLLSTFVGAATVAIVGRMVFLPVLALRRSLAAARDDPAGADRHRLPDHRDDELGEAMREVNRLFSRVARTYREDLAVITEMANRAANAIIACDPADRIVYANRACLQLMRAADVQELQMRSPPRFVFTSSERQVSLIESLADGPYSREAQLVLPGLTIRCLVSASRFDGDAAAPLRYYASISDISELHAAQETLQQQNLELMAANHAKSEFFANMSHELRTPLNAILGFSELMLGEAFGPLGDRRYREYLGDIHASGAQLLEIVNQVLDLSRIEAGKMNLADDEIDLVDLMECIGRVLRHRIAEAGQTLSVEIDPLVRRLRADRRAIRQITMNLLVNASKFTLHGGRIGVIATPDDEGRCVLKISDTGIGIAEDKLAQILVPFNQADSSLTRRFGGTGIGLPLSARLAALHGATLSIDSHVGVGTIVSVTFQAARVVQSAPPAGKGALALSASG